MKKLSYSLCVAVVVAPLLMQCASQDELNQIHYQLRRLDKKVTDIESKTIDDIQKRYASTSNQIDTLQQDFLALKSELEEAGHLNRRLKEQSKELETAFKNYTKQEEEKRTAQISKLNQEITEKDQQLELLARQIQNQQENLKAIQQARVEEAKRKAEAAARKAEEARIKADAANRAAQGAAVPRLRAEKRKKLITASAAAASTTPASPTATAAAPEPSPEASSKARDLYEQGKYREAYQIYEKIANTGGNDPATINARYMMGECLFGLKEYDQAILDYQAIITNHPSSSKAPTAMLRQAIAFESLNDKDTAKILYRKILASYKESPEALQAQKKLDTL